MLTLPIKKKWFDMILSGKKKEEYREIKPYYISRFKNTFYKKEYVSDDEFLEKLRNVNGYKLYVCLRNGYSKNSSSFVTKCTLSIGTGEEEWGAEKDKEYFVFSIHELL